MIETITSKDNKKLKMMIALSTKKGRDKHGAYFVEGRRLVDEACQYARSDIKFITLSEAFVSDHKTYVTGLVDMGISVYIVADKLFKEVSNTVTPQGIAAVLSVKKPCELSEDANRILVLDGISEPGNMGTIIRTAEAAGVDYIYVMKGCADVYNPKVVRSTMGSIFRARLIFSDSVDEISDLKDLGFRIISSALENSVDIYEYKNNFENSKTALVIGSEAYGVSRDILNISDVRVRIPMKGLVESLNASVASGILLYLL